MNVKVIGVSKHYDVGSTKINAVDDISLDISDGDFVALTGPTGSGKTTLLSIIGTLITPNRGTIYYGNEKVSGIQGHFKLAKVRRDYLSFAFQTAELIPHLTTLENILIPLRFKTKVSVKHKEEALAYLERLGMLSKASSSPSMLSGGEQKKASILRAVMYGGRLLLVDEPTGDLDETSADEVLGILKEINKKGTSVVMVTHSQKHALEAKSVYSLEHGKITELKK